MEPRGRSLLITEEDKHDRSNLMYCLVEGGTLVLDHARGSCDM